MKSTGLLMLISNCQGSQLTQNQELHDVTTCDYILVMSHFNFFYMALQHGSSDRWLVSWHNGGYTKCQCVRIFSLTDWFSYVITLRRTIPWKSKLQYVPARPVHQGTFTILKKQFHSMHKSPANHKPVSQGVKSFSAGQPDLAFGIPYVPFGQLQKPKTASNM